MPHHKLVTMGHCNSKTNDSIEPTYTTNNNSSHHQLTTHKPTNTSDISLHMCHTPVAGNQYTSESLIVAPQELDHRSSIATTQLINLTQTQYTRTSDSDIISNSNTGRSDPSTYLCSLNDFEVRDLIGKGAFGMFNDHHLHVFD